MAQNSFLHSYNLPDKNPDKIVLMLCLMLIFYVHVIFIISVDLKHLGQSGPCNIRSNMYGLNKIKIAVKILSQKGRTYDKNMYDENMR